MELKICDIFTSDDIKKYKLQNLNQNLRAIYDINCKTLDIKNFSNDKYYRIVYIQYLKFLGFIFVANEIINILGSSFYEDKKIEIVYVSKIINLLQDAKICSKTIVEVISSLDEMKNINYNLYEGIEREFFIRFEFKEGVFLYKGIINNIANLEQSIKETRTAIEIKFKLKINEEEKYNICDKICIKTEDKDYIFEFNCSCEEVRKVSAEHKWVYDFIDFKIINDEFEKKTELDFRNILKELKDYKNLSIYVEASRFAKAYSLDWKEIFEVIKNKNVDLEERFSERLVENNKLVSIKKELLAIKKSLFFSKDKRGFAGIEKYINYLMNDGTDKVLIIDDRYKKLKLKLIGYLKNDTSIYNEAIFRKRVNIKRDKNFDVNTIFTKNPCYFLQNIKIPDEFYFYVFDNIDKFESNEVKEFIKIKLMTILKQKIVFTLPKTKLLKFANKLFIDNDDEYKIIKYKLNQLVSFNYENKEELIILKNDFLENSFIIEICDSKNIENYIVKIDGRSAFISMNNIKVYEMNNNFNFNLNELKDIICISKLNYENSFMRICKFNMFYNYYKNNKKIDLYIENLFIKNRGDFYEIYSSIKDLEVNKTQIQLFKENIDNKFFIKNFISNETNDENLFDILNFIGYKNLSLYIRTLFLFRFYELDTRKLKVTELCERMIADKPFIIKKVKRLLQRQYDEGLFTDESSKIIDLLKYSEQGLEIYIIKLKIRNKEFDTEFVQIIRELYEKNKLYINFKKNIYTLVANKKISGLTDIVFEMNKNFEDVTLTNYMITTNIQYKKLFLTKNDAKLAENIIRLYNNNEFLSEAEKNIGFEIIEKIDCFENSNEVVKFLEKNYEMGRLEREEIKKVRVYFTRAKRLMILYIRELSREFMKDCFMSKYMLDYRIDSEDIKYIIDGINSKIISSKDDKFLAYVILIKKYIIEKNKEELRKVINDIVSDSDINIIVFIEKIAYQDVSQAITIFSKVYSSIRLEEDLNRILEVLIDKMNHFKVYSNVSNILEILNKINFYNEKIIKELLILCLYEDSIDYITYTYVINISLRKLNDKTAILDYLSKRADLPKDIYYEYFKDKKNYSKKINEYYLNADIDDLELKEIAMKEYFYSDEKFINLLNRKGINDSIKSLVKDKIREKFKEDIYYCEKLINSYYIYNDQSFVDLRWHINNYFEKKYIENVYIENCFIEKKFETLMCEKLDVKDIFTNDIKILYKFKSPKLENKIISYVKNKLGLKVTEVGVRNFDLNLDNSKLLEISSVDLLKLVKEFLLFLSDLDKINVSISDKTDLFIINNNIFVCSVCDFVENKKFDNQIFKVVLKNFIEKYSLAIEEFKNIEEIIDNSTSYKNMLVEIREILLYT